MLLSKRGSKGEESRALGSSSTDEEKDSVSPEESLPEQDSGAASSPVEVDDEDEDGFPQILFISSRTCMNSSSVVADEEDKVGSFRHIEAAFVETAVADMI